MNDTACVCKCGILYTHIKVTNSPIQVENAYFCEHNHVSCTHCISNIGRGSFECSVHKKRVWKVTQFLKRMFSETRVPIVMSSMGGLKPIQLDYMTYRSWVLQQPVLFNKKVPHGLLRFSPVQLDPQFTLQQCMEILESKADTNPIISKANKKFVVDPIENDVKYVIDISNMLVVKLTFTWKTQTIECAVLFYAPEEECEKLLKISLLIEETHVMEQTHVINTATPTKIPVKVETRKNFIYGCVPTNICVHAITTLT